MPRYIIIDTNSGYVFGDTANLPCSHVFAGGPCAGEAARDCEITPELAARWLDEHERLADPTSTYEDTDPGDYRTTYFVYRADINGSEAVPAVWDGQDQETIEAVERDCRLVARIARLACSAS